MGEMAFTLCSCRCRIWRWANLKRQDRTENCKQHAMPPKKRAKFSNDDSAETIKIEQAENSIVSAVKSETEPVSGRTNFKLQLKGDNNKHLKYEMFIKEREKEDSLYVVDYTYGSFGAAGKSYIKCFTELEKATEFIANKYTELWTKGYREDIVGTPIAMINNPGDRIYLEHHDKYSGDKSFYELEMSKNGKYVIVREGEVGGTGRVGSFPVEDDVAEAISRRVLDHTSRHYKKKPRPKFMETFKFIDDFSESEGEVEGDESDEDE